MNNSLAKMTIWAGNNFACIKIAGRANLNSSIDFKNVMNELRQRGCPRYILELSECTLMDSTFLGVLAGLGLRNGGEAGGNQIELLNPNIRVTGLLESLGVLHLFRVEQGPLIQPAGAEQREVTPSPQPKTALAATCLEAHETLMQIDPANVPKFKDVAQFMAEDLRRGM
jgi:anti-anti-sigma factor